MLKIHWKDWCWSWSSNTLATWCKQPIYWKRPWCWKRLKAEEEGDRGWDGWMASLVQWTWTWANSKRWCGTGKPGMLQATGLQRVRHNLVTEQQLIPYRTEDSFEPQYRDNMLIKFTHKHNESQYFKVQRMKSQYLKYFHHQAIRFKEGKYSLFNKKCWEN